MKIFKRHFQAFDLNNPDNDIDRVIEFYVEDPLPVNAKNLTEYFKDEYVTETFSQTVLKYVIEQDLSSKDIYERSFIDRKLFHKILSVPGYHPSKKTVLALCIALRLNLEQATQLLMLADYALSKNSKYDLIFKFAFTEGAYDLDDINECLAYFNLPCIGS